jgi:hypothetical protein
VKDGLRTAEWSARYGELEDTYGAFTNRVLALLEPLLEEAGLDPWHTYTWTLSESQFADLLNRARRAGQRLTDPLLELGGLSGVSIVMPSPTELEAVADIVVAELGVEYGNSRPVQEMRELLERRLSNGQTEVDYPHAYYTVTVPDRRRRLSEWKPFADLRTEVHVLTISQYASWCLDYSQMQHHWPESYAPAAREAFVRVNSLLAEADRVLEGEAESRDAIAEEYETAILEGNLEIELDVPAVAAYIRVSPTLHELAAVAEAEGMEHDEQEELELSKYNLEQRTLWLLRKHGIDTLAALDGFVGAALPRARSILGDLARVSSERGYVPVATREDVLAFLVVVLHRASAEEIELAEYSDELEYALNTLIGNPITEPG